MIVTGKELYDYFIDQTTERSRALPWDELPAMVQNAWTGIGRYVIDKLVGAANYGETKSR